MFFFFSQVLAQGVPPAETFPLRAIELTLADGAVVRIDGAAATNAQRYACWFYRLASVIMASPGGQPV